MNGDDLMPQVYLAVAAGAEWGEAVSAGPDALVLDAAAFPGKARPFASLHPSPGIPMVFVAVGPVSGSSIEADLDSAMGLSPAGLILRGCVGRRDLEHLSAKLAVREAELDRPDGITRIVAMADDAAAVLALPSLASAENARLVGIGCDLDRVRAELRCRDDAPALRLAAGAAVTVAAAARVPAVAVPGRGEADPWLRFDQLHGQGFQAILVRNAADVEAAREVFGEP